MAWSATDGRWARSFSPQPGWHEVFGRGGPDEAIYQADDIGPRRKNGPGATIAPLCFQRRRRRPDRRTTEEDARGNVVAMTYARTSGTRGQYLHHPQGASYGPDGAARRGWATHSVHDVPTYTRLLQPSSHEGTEALGRRRAGIRGTTLRAPSPAFVPCCASSWAAGGTWAPGVHPSRLAPRGYPPPMPPPRGMPE